MSPTTPAQAASVSTPAMATGSRPLRAARAVPVPTVPGRRVAAAIARPTLAAAWPTATTAVTGWAQAPSSIAPA